jgi:hypothetical protein
MQEQILKIPGNCPGCGLRAKLAARSINRKVECPRCGLWFIVTPGEPVRIVPKKVEARTILMMCGKRRTWHDLHFERAERKLLFEMVKGGLGGSGKATWEEFDWDDFYWSDFKCSGCAAAGFGYSSTCCKILFCDGAAGPEDADGGRYMVCPGCGVGHRHKRELKRIWGIAGEGSVQPGLFSNTSRKLLGAGGLPARASLPYKHVGRNRP